ncbi:ABC transporter ATP-binding protein [Treponema parvum]|uniref:ABC transporter ATP-binding protein n=1 Tax=Treponema parvum TaxID=138851 RepID=UPI001AEC0D60|nr:ABC transporter ATP-binding protein [Treponema parvum]QTQ16815.1 ABC transporter ATP-binding protein [Treponema parvum]
MIFSVENGFFSYGNTTVLSDISFAIESPEILCVLGSNGVGKTTLLKCMMGIQKWNRGKTLIDGKRLEQIPTKKLWQKIAYVPQAKNSMFAYTALDMILMGRSAHLGVFAQPSAKDYEIALKSMTEVGILHLKDKLCTQISGGELQMVLIARALTTNPQLLILDEPESNLDFKNQLIILDTIKKMSSERGISAIVNTHYPAHALQIADKALILNKDGTHKFGECGSTITEDSLRKSFSVNVAITGFARDKREYRTVVPLSIVN